MSEEKEKKSWPYCNEVGFVLTEENIKSINLVRDTLVMILTKFESIEKALSTLELDNYLRKRVDINDAYNATYGLLDSMGFLMYKAREGNGKRNAEGE